VPYRIDLRDPAPDALDRLVALGALDVDPTDAGLAALLPDRVSPEQAATVLGVVSLETSPAIGRDDESVWVLRPRPVRVGRLLIEPAPGDIGQVGQAGLRVVLRDSGAFGTGLHPTTALCIEALDDAIEIVQPASVLDVGTGSGVLAIAALVLGVPHATAVDTDAAAIAAAHANATLNHVTDRLTLVHGGADAVPGTWSLVVANILAAPLIEIAPILVRRVAHRGRLVLSGIPVSTASEVDRTYVRLGMRHVSTQERDGWVAVVLDASW